MGVTGICHRLFASLGLESSQLKLLKSGQLSARAIRRLALSDGDQVRQEAWKVINSRPEIIGSGAKILVAGVRRLWPEAERVLRQREAIPRTVAWVLHDLTSVKQPDGELDYLLGLLKEYDTNKQGDILSELAKIDLNLMRSMNTELLKSRR